MTLTFVRSNYSHAIGINCNERREELIRVHGGVRPQVKLPTHCMRTDHLIAVIKIVAKQDGKLGDVLPVVMLAQPDISSFHRLLPMPYTLPW